MSEIKAKGLCLRAIEYGDNDKLCTLYLLEYGKSAVKFRGVKKAKAKLAFAASPLCFGEYIVNERSGYHTCTGCSMITSFMPLWQDIDKFYAAISAVELLDKFTRQDQLNDDAALIVIDYLNELLASDNVLVSCLNFLTRFAVVSGYGITQDSLAQERIAASAKGLKVIKSSSSNAMLEEYKSNEILDGIMLGVKYLETISESKLKACMQMIEYYISRL